MSTRSAGRSVDGVIRITRGYLRGLQEHGLVATLKHFPGDGYTTYDQHLTTVQNPLSMSEWWNGPGRIYRALIDAGAKTIMPGHIALPAYDELDPERGLCPPATLSRRLLQDLLRGELGFEGLIVSDAMGMAGAAGFVHPFDAYARFLEAGGDCVLVRTLQNMRSWPVSWRRERWRWCEIARSCCRSLSAPIHGCCMSCSARAARRTRRCTPA